MASLLGALEGGAIGIAVGEAGATVLEPALEAPKQEAWAKSKAKILDLHELAQLVATTLNVLADVEDDAHRNGYDDDALRSAVQLALKAPGPPDAGKLWLRAQGGYPGSITEDQLFHAYGKAGLEGQWWAALRDADANQLLTPAQLALGAVRGTVPDSGLLVVELDTSDSNVKKYTPAAIDIVKEAQAAGINAERLRAMIGSIGLPMAVELAARATFRQILTKGAYYQAVLEGDTRPEWADSIFEVAREIPTSREYMENYLRGWTPDFGTALANAAKHGMSAADATIVFQNMGRPLALHQITTGLARGGTYGGFYAGVPEPYLPAVRESNIRPEYGNLAYANRYTYPPGFQIKAEAEKGVLSVAQTEELLLQVGWDPKWATFFANAWASAAASVNRHITSATTSLVTATRKAYIGGAATQPQAVEALNVAGLDPGEQSQLFTLWDATRKIESLAPAAPPVLAPPGGG